jgi:hypothetical protein
MLSVVALAGALTVTTSSQSADWKSASEWFLQVQEQALAEAMPLTLPDLVVAYRATQEMSPDAHERYFAIQYGRVQGVIFRDLLTAIVVRPMGRSIQQQLIGLRMQDRAAPLSALVSRLSLRRHTLDTSACKAIATQMNRLSEVRMSMPRSDIITFDATVHRIVVNMIDLKMTATISMNENPLVDWAERTHELLLDCLRMP